MAAVGVPRQRLRGTSFKQEYQGPAGARKGRQRAPSMNQENSKWVLPEQLPDLPALVKDFDRLSAEERARLKG